MEINFLDLGILSGNVITVVLFINYVRSRDIQMTKMHDSCETRIEAIATKCLEKMEQNIEAFRKLENKLDWIKK